MFVSVIAQFIARDDVIFPLHVFLKTHTHTHTHVGTITKNSSSWSDHLCFENNLLDAIFIFIITHVKKSSIGII